MDHLTIGLAEKQFTYPKGSLVITDEPILKRGVKIFDPAKHGLNPFPMQYREAREFAAAVFPDKDLMTYRNGRCALARVMNADRLDRLQYTRGDEEAKGGGGGSSGIAALTGGATHRSPDGSIPAPRSWLGLTGRRSGTTMPRSREHSYFSVQRSDRDRGLWVLCPTVSPVTDPGELIAGVHTLSELNPELRQMCLLMETAAVGCTHEDAELLARYEGRTPNTNAWNSFVQRAMA